MASRRAATGQEIVVVNTGQPAHRRGFQWVGEQHNKTGMGIAVLGGVLAWIVGTDSFSQMETVKKNWWVIPAVVLLLGYYLWKRNHKYAAAVIAVGGCLLVQMWRKQSEEEKAKKKADDPTKKTEGIEDFRWIQTEGGEMVGIPYTRAVLTEGNLSMNDLADQIVSNVYARAA